LLIMRHEMEHIEEVQIKSTADGNEQPILIHKAAGANRPLIAVLQTWSFDRYNQVDNFLPFAVENDFNLVFPEFRGPNTPGNPNGAKACCSDAAIQDVFDAVEYFKAHYDCDECNIFLTGASGGGLMALMACSKNPAYFKGVQAIVPITDLVKWYEENSGYRPHLEYCFGGVPEGELLEEYRKRSPINYAEALSKANLRICSGKFDGVVRYTHGLSLYNEIVKYNPNSRTFLEVFDGEHDQNVEDQIRWIMSQIEKKELVKVTG